MRLACRHCFMFYSCRGSLRALVVARMPTGLSALDGRTFGVQCVVLRTAAVRGVCAGRAAGRASGLLVLADQQASGVGQVHVRRHLKIVRRGLFLNTRPARSNVEPWQGHRKPPAQSSGSDGCAPGVNLSVGEQPRCEQMPTTTRYSGLIERYWFFAYLPASGSGTACGQRFGVEPPLRRSSSATSIISLVRRTTQTGLPRHSTRLHLAGHHVADVDLDRCAGRLGPLGRGEAC